MKIYLLFALLLCFTLSSNAAFPVAHHIGDSTEAAYKRSTLPQKVGPFSTISAYSFLLTCASIVVVGVISITNGWFDYGSAWFLGASIVAEVSVIAAALGIIFGEGRYARIMLFCSLFFLLVLLLIFR